MKRSYWLFAGMLFLCVSAFSQVVYVKADAAGANNGSSWTDAYTNLATALANTSNGEVWVAKGTYKPGTDTLSRFEIKNALALYGGFAGTETSAGQRDPVANPTFLDGDVNGDDIAGDFDNHKSDNVFHVVYVDSLIPEPVRIDGFTIRNGHTHPESEGLDAYFSQGAGLWALSAVDVRNCVFTQHFSGAGAGAAILGEGANGSSFQQVVFDGNQAASNGVLLAVLTSGLDLDQVTFRNNLTESGAFQTVFCANINIDHSAFTNNRDTVTGGFSAGLFAWQSINIAVSNTTFTGNEAANGAAVYVDGRDIQGESLGGYRFTNVTFDGNTVAGGLGTAYFFQAYDVDFLQSKFENNVSNGGFAAGIYSRADAILAQNPVNFSIDSCLFNNNSTANRGGAIFLNNTASRIANSDFTDNHANVIGGAIYIVDITGGPLFQVDLDHCNLNGNTSAFGAGIGHQGDNATFTLKNSALESNIAGTSGAGAYLGAAGIAPVLIENTTFVNNEAGAGGGFIYFMNDSELSVKGALFENNSTNNDGGGMYISSAGASILIDDTEFNNNSSTGYGGGAIMLFADTSNVVISNSDFTENLGATGGGGAIYYGSTDATLTVSNTRFNANTNTFGGAVANFATGSLATYRDCSFTENSGATGGGGALTNGFGVRLEVENCLFENNTGTVGAAIRVQNDDVITSYKGATFEGNIASSGGGGIFVFGFNPTSIDSCFFINNQAPTGGAVYVSQDTNLTLLAEISRSLFRLNTAGGQGGAINHGNINIDIDNCLFTGNAANDTGTGGAISLNASNASNVVANIWNSTFSDNLGALAGGIAAWTDPTEAGVSNATINLANNIFYNTGDKNYAIEDGSPVVLSLGGNLTIDPESTLDIYLSEASDKLNEDPLFVDPTGFLDPNGVPNLRLLAGSPAIDAALPAYAPAFDIEGTPRPQGDGPDMGAYETLVVRTEEVLPNNGLLTISPNPVKADAMLQLKGAWEGPLTLRISDNTGRVLRQIATRKTGEKLLETIPVADLPSGAYRVTATNGKQMIICSMIKQ